MTLTPGTLIDSRFEVLDVIGQGGMGVVYRARQREMERDVALKVLKPALSLQPDKMKRFQREAQLVSKLDHPNIVRVYAVGVDHEKPYIAMEYLSGRQLSEALSADGPLGWKQAIPLFMQLCDALIYAHENSIIHRDIKPSNIVLISGTADSTAVKLVDFGIAKSLGAEGEKLTQTEMVLGSVFYLSPGQFQGRQADVSADIYSLGCTFFEVLAGEPPFVGDTIYDTIAKSAAESLPKVNSVNPKAEIPASLQQLLEAMTAKDPAHRIASAQIVRRNLARIEKGLELESQVEVPVKVNRTNKGIKTLVLYATVAALVGAGGVLFYNNLKPQHAAPQIQYLTNDPREREYVGIITIPGAAIGRLASNYWHLAEIYRSRALFLQAEYVALQGLAICGTQSFQEYNGLAEEAGFDKLMLGETQPALEIFITALKKGTDREYDVSGHLLDAYVRRSLSKEAAELLPRLKPLMAEQPRDGSKDVANASIRQQAALVMIRLGRYREALTYVSEAKKERAFMGEANALSLILLDLIARTGAGKAVSEQEISAARERVFAMESADVLARLRPSTLFAELLIRRGQAEEGLKLAHEFAQLINSPQCFSVSGFQQIEYMRNNLQAIEHLLPREQAEVIKVDGQKLDRKLDDIRAFLNDASHMHIPVPTDRVDEANKRLK